LMICALVSRSGLCGRNDMYFASHIASVDLQLPETVICVTSLDAGYEGFKRSGNVTWVTASM
jgi:hypothetical protein